MKILDKLKSVGFYFPKLKSVSLIKLSININKSTRIDHVDGGGAIITINPNKLSDSKKLKLKRVIREHALDSAGVILEEKNSAKVEAVVDSLPSIHEVTNKFRAIIPASDVPLLQACVY